MQLARAVTDRELSDDILGSGISNAQLTAGSRATRANGSLDAGDRDMKAFVVARYGKDEVRAADVPEPDGRYTATFSSR